jgi:N-acylneuraminate cytidylyltransferase
MDNIKYKASKIKLVAMDCDGVLTDGSMYYSNNGDEFKKFNTLDGMGVELLRSNNIKSAIITKEDNNIIKLRAKKMKVDNLFAGISNKLSIIDKLINLYNIKLGEIAYIGDDINDLEVLKVVGFSCSVKNGMKYIKDIVDYVTILNGGSGAVREVIDIILKYKNK